MKKNSYLSGLILCLILCTFISCILSHKKVFILPDSQVVAGYSTEAAVKAHMINHDVVVMPEGFHVTTIQDSLCLVPNIPSFRYDMTSNNQGLVKVLYLDDIIHLEVFQNQMDPLVFLTSLPYFAVGGTLAAVAIFGSCPTYYSYDGQSFVLEAEGFSYSIIPEFEVDDLDKLFHLKSVDNKVKIQVRNEALETHYIDQLSLTSVDHDPAYHAYSAIVGSDLYVKKKEVFLIGEPIPLERAVDKSGQNILGLIEQSDGDWYRSSEDALDSLHNSPDYKDWVEIDVNVPEDQKEIFLIMNLRNSLLNSVFFYDVLLDAQNFGAIDWLDSELGNFVASYKFMSWYRKYFGMTVEILENDKFREVTKFGDLGPISWSERALKIPLKETGKVRLRLKYLPDNWQIDWLAISLESKTDIKSKEYNLGNKKYISDPGNNYVSTLQDNDNEYFITYPGTCTNFEVQAEPEIPGMQRTWFIRSRGYYTEWLRQDWLKGGDDESHAPPLELTDATVKKLARLWSSKKDKFEKEFFDTMIPTDLNEKS